MDAAWAEQQALRKIRRAKTKDEELELGWKTKREIHIAAYENALIEADDLQVGAWEKKQRIAEIRRARIYLEGYNDDIKDGDDKTTAKSIANNNLIKAGLRRLDGEVVGRFTKQYNEMNVMEYALRELLNGK